MRKEKQRIWEREAETLCLISILVRGKRKIRTQHIWARWRKRERDREREREGERERETERERERGGGESANQTDFLHFGREGGLPMKIKKKAAEQLTLHSD